MAKSLSSAHVSSAHVSSTPRRVCTSIDELLDGVTSREPMEHTDSKSGARFERVTIGGENFVVKYLDLTTDWTLRTLGDIGSANLYLWREGILDRLPDCIVQPIVGVACDPTCWPPSRGTTLLMRDIGDTLVPPGDDPIPLAQHLGFLDHMAAMHATFWEAGTEIDLTPMSNRYMELSPWLAIVEAELGSDALVPRLVGEGWKRLGEIEPAIAAGVLPLAWDPSPLVAALCTTPTTLVHGNWKFGNLGTASDGRTVVFDWESPGRGNACGDLAWYLAINSARIPQSKEVAIDAFRSALEGHGIDTGPWWDRQIALGLLGGLVQFGWEKALGGPSAELDWWGEQVAAGLAQL